MKPMRFHACVQAVPIVVAALLLGAAPPGWAQSCDLRWSDQFAFAGLDGEIAALVVFDDGRGPALYSPSSSKTASAYPRPVAPMPSADQEVPFHLAMLSTSRSPDMVNEPSDTTQRRSVRTSAHPSDGEQW